MAVSDFLNGAIREFAFRNYPVSMACACIALDATAKKVNPGLKKVGDRCRAFIDSYYDIITVVGTAGAIRADPGGRFCLPDPLNPGQFAAIQDIIYESIRCCLIHDAGLAAHISFTDEAFLGVQNTKLVISTRMIVALLLAVAASPGSKGMVIDESWVIILDSRQIPFNAILGDRGKVMAWIGI